ncbi:hypothetical protein PUNSTDRAFT_137067 [Punctularia strigosozonata HHB-11173 SS5]|uniref:uncharacterized protein n=1 Tax=Punctularia strigosozonata (strain HHB-11173) TaxID=741275 RepID=UPI000441744F|nr:uncharacterized protein PUNSTDRAFT_137067 [Punctularia strigosozonata HHB-11173 SS5]EIN06285.1 hypothetical protein PUNSTDRAFT_137067 [Punctularia strigosozonata HHB-11173 SS5]
MKSDLGSSPQPPSPAASGEPGFDLTSIRLELEGIANPDLELSSEGSVIIRAGPRSSTPSALPVTPSSDRISREPSTPVGRVSLNLEIRSPTRRGVVAVARSDEETRTSTIGRPVPPAASRDSEYPSAEGPSPSAVLFVPPVVRPPENGRTGDKCYVVFRGLQTGVYRHWGSAARMVKNPRGDTYPGALWRLRYDLAAAQRELEDARASGSSYVLTPP